MELDELKSNLKAANQRLDQMETIQASLQKVVLKGQTKSAANRLRVEPIFELIVGIVTAIWSGGFLTDNLAKIPQAPIGAIPGVLIFALSVFTIALSVRQLVIVSEMDFSNPIVETQQRIATLRSIRVRSTQLTLLIGIPLWFVFIIFPLQALIGYEFVPSLLSKLAESAGMGWVWGNVAFAILMPVGIILAARKFGMQSLFFRKLNEILAGTEVVRAQKMLSEVALFEKG